MNAEGINREERKGWDHNIWTGHDLLRVPKMKGRIVRQKFHNPESFLYSAEFWGDYSLAYPIRGPWQKTLRAAMNDLRTEHSAFKRKRRK